MALENDLWSVFLAEHFIEKNKTKIWVKSHQFYYGDLSKTRLDNDWRFKEVSKKRKQAIFLGLVHTEFPIKYPIKTVCNKVINNCY